MDHVETGYFTAEDVGEVLKVARHFRGARGGLHGLTILESATGIYISLNPIKEAAYGPEHREIAVTLTNLGVAYGGLGNTKRTRDLLERALAI